MNQRSRLMQIVLWLGLMASVGCSSFPREFTQATEAYVPSQRPDGPWQGEWTSQRGHRGSLRCLVDFPNEAAPCECYFEAKFWGIFTAHYRVTLHVRPSLHGHGAQVLEGAQDLGGLGGGMYHYEATITPTRFDATYRSDLDQGVFHMQRPGK